jgi:hypothetical protein
LANFLSISPHQTKPSFSLLLAQLDFSATSDSASAVSEGYQLNYCCILKMLKVHKREKFFGSDFEFFTIL